MFRTALFSASVLACLAATSAVCPARESDRTTADSSHFVEAPPGFTEACRVYRWLCSNETAATATLSDEEIARLGAMVSRDVNGAVQQATDREIYGTAERWALPSSGLGDCEDLALEKMRRLLDLGVPADRVVMAIVLDRHGENHAVLILHLGDAEIVLDSLTDRVVAPLETGYRMLAMQTSADRARWAMADEVLTAHLMSTAAVPEHDGGADRGVGGDAGSER